MIEKIIRKGFKLGLKIGSLTKREAKRAARIALKGRKIKRNDLENLAKNIILDSIKEQRRLRNIIQKEARTSVNKIISSTKKRIQSKKRR